MSTFKKRLKTAAKVILVLGVIVYGVTGYMIPTKLHGIYVSNQAIYENDPISKDHFVVYTTSRFGRVEYIDDYDISSGFVDHTGKITVTSKELNLSTDVNLHPIKIRASEISYNDKCYEDAIDSYKTDVSEIIYYSDGSMKNIPASQLEVGYSVDTENEMISLTVSGTNGIYKKEIPIVTVESITTNDKVSTKNKLTSDDLKMTIHYSDGTSAVADKSDISSDVIKHPKDGKNKLSFYYNDEEYTVNVTASQSIGGSSVTFEKYGTFVLQYSKAYVTNTTRLNIFDGVEYFNNHRETYYSARVLSGTALDIPGRHVAEDGTIRDKDGYICVASDFSYCSKYSVVLTTLGPAKVYDCGCPYGTIDLYVNW